jgi:16S rRNA (guanine(1405)-N(7))-methyltransferase
MAKDQIDILVAEVLASSKYRTISPELVRIIGMRTLATQRKLRDAIKETKNKLHQVGGSYLAVQPSYATWLATLQPATHDQTQLRAASIQIMMQHASTRERLPILDPFYHQIFTALPPIRRVLDVACGLNPLAMPWMPLATNAEYYACDIYSDMIAFVGAFLAQTNTAGKAWVCDLVSTPPTIEADLVLALKVLPVLEQIEKGAALRLLQTLQAPHIVVSFPTKTLSGRQKGMEAHYLHWFETLVAGQGWQLQPLHFANELAILIST